MGEAPPAPGGALAASQICWGSPASQRAWIGDAPPEPPGVGSWANASQIACGRPASHAGWSGLGVLPPVLPPVPPPVPPPSFAAARHLLRIRRDFVNLARALCWWVFARFSFLVIALRF